MSQCPATVIKMREKCTVFFSGSYVRTNTTFRRNLNQNRMRIIPYAHRTITVAFVATYELVFNLRRCAFVFGGITSADAKMNSVHRCRPPQLARRRHVRRRKIVEVYTIDLCSRAVICIADWTRLGRRANVECTIHLKIRIENCLRFLFLPCLYHDTLR